MGKIKRGKRTKTGIRKRERGKEEEQERERQIETVRIDI